MKAASVFYALAWLVFFVHLVFQIIHVWHREAQSAIDADFMAFGCFLLLTALWHQRRES